MERKTPNRKRQVLDFGLKDWIGKRLGKTQEKVMGQRNENTENKTTQNPDESFLTAPIELIKMVPV